MGVASNKSRRGQSLVELALAMPLLVLLLLGASDFARSISAYITIGNMAREGAHYGSLNQANLADTAGITAAALGETGDSKKIFGVAPTVKVETKNDGFKDPSGQDYKFVRVTVTYKFQPLVTFGTLGPLTMQRTAQMRVLGG